LKQSLGRENRKARIVTIEDLDEVEVLGKATARAAKRVELMLPSLERVREDQERQRQQASKAAIVAGEVEREQIIAEAFTAINVLSGLADEYRELEGTTRAELRERFDKGR